MTTVVTHNGAFHADEIFAIATLRFIFPDLTVTRSRDKGTIDSADIAIDVGGAYDPSRLRFDHHQTGGAGQREVGIPFASFGLIWKEYGEKVAGREEAAIIDRKLVAPIDAIDNGFAIYDLKFDDIEPYTVVDYFGSFSDHQNRGANIPVEKFMNIVELARELLVREINNAHNKVEARTKVEEIYNNAEDKRIILIPEDIPWTDVMVQKPEPLYIIYQVSEKKWYARAVPAKRTGFEVRKPFPKDWGGKMDHELAEITGVPDALFCHKNLFLCTSESKEGALKLAQIALNS